MKTTYQSVFSQACENNKGPILVELREHFAHARKVLEIGSGTGQHAVHFAANLPHLEWQTADQAEYHDGINAWINEFPSANLLKPIALSLPKDAWPSTHFDAIYTANTAHIMQAADVKYMMGCISDTLPSGGTFCQYGPFTVDGKFNSQSNADFHERLLASGYGGYRDISELKAWAPNLSLTKVATMPANNLLLVWR